MAFPFRELVRCLLDVVWPERCVVCGACDELCRPGTPVAGLRPWDHPHLCSCCLERIVERPAPVRRLTCGSPVLAAVGTGDELAQVVGAMKYDGIRGAAWPLGRLLVQRVGGEVRAGGVDALVPVPLHRGRRSERGFNQADVLARLLAAGCGVPVVSADLDRRRGTAQQAKLSGGGDERGRNVAGAFRCREEGRGRRVVIVDDILTSGATVDDAVRALGEAGWTVVAAAVVGAAAASS